MFVYLVIRITVVLRKVTLLCVGNSLAPTSQKQRWCVVVVPTLDQQLYFNC